MKWNRMYGFMFIINLCMSTCALSYDQPVVNLGYTSFLDGGPPAGPGFYFQDYFQYYTSDRFNDKNGNKLPFPRTDLNVVANITQLIYLSTKKILGGNLGVSALVPWVLSAKVKDGLNNTVLRANDGPSDLVIGPALQYDPVMRKDGKGPLFVQRIEFDVIAPIGRYNHNNAINPSSNFWSLNPYWAFTYWITPKWTNSVRMHYLWNAKNTRPNIAFGPNVFSTQAGQAVFANIATEYEITERFHLGINGYFFDQITDTRANGVKLSGRKEFVWAIGPGFLFGITKEQFLFFNLYSEQNAINHPQGINCILRYAIHF